MRAEAVFLALVASVVAALVLYPGALTGNAALNFDITPGQAGTLNGLLSYDTSEGVALPLDSEVIVGLNNYYTRKPLSQLIDPVFITQYAQTIEFTPAVQIQVDVRSTTRAQIVRTPNASVSTTEGGESLSPGLTGNVGVDITPSSGGGSSNPSSNLTTLPNSPASANPSSAGSPTVSHRTYTVRYGQDIALPDGQYSISSVRLVRGDRIDTSYASVSSRDGTNYLSTSYIETTRGFPLGTPRIGVDLSSFDLVPGPRAQLSAIIYYRGEKLDEAQKTLSSTTISPLLSPSDDSGTTAEELLKRGCVVSHCGAYSACASSFGQNSFDVSKDSLFQVRTCKYSDCGLTYKEQRSCTPTSVPIDVVPREGSSGLLTSPPLARISRPNAWRQTHSFINEELRSRGRIEQTLGEAERVQVRVENEVHEVDVLKVADGQVVLEVASTPQQTVLGTGESGFFDLVPGDAYYDLKVSVISIQNEQASIFIESTNEKIPFGAVHEGDKAVTLVRKETNEPVAHLLVNTLHPLVDVVFVESYNEVPYECYNTVRDAGEDGVDCGGSCKACSKNTSRYIAPIGLWILALVLGTSAGIVLRRSVRY